MEEIWKPVVGYEGRYEVSNLGRVRTVATGHIKVASVNPKTGYGSIALFVGDNCKRKDTHRIVAEAFLPNPENKGYVDHIDTNRRNDRVDNLRWVTQAENCANEITKARALKSARTRKPKSRDDIERTNASIRAAWTEEKRRARSEKMRGENNYFYGKHHTEEYKKTKRKVVYQYSLAGDLIKEWDSLTSVNETLGLSIPHLSQCCNGKRKTTGGYRWSYTK